MGNKMSEFKVLFSHPKTEYAFVPTPFSQPAKQAGPMSELQTETGEPVTTPAPVAATPATPAAPTEEEIQARIEQARAAGIEEGRAQREDEISALSARRQDLEELANDLGQLRPKAVKQAADDLCGIIQHFCHKAMGSAFELQTDTLKEVIKNAMEALPQADDILIRVRPEQLEFISSEFASSQHVRVEADETITGGCIVQTRFATIEATLDAAMHGLDEAIKTWKTSQES